MCSTKHFGEKMTSPQIPEKTTKRHLESFQKLNQECFIPFKETLKFRPTGEDITKHRAKLLAHHKKWSHLLLWIFVGPLIVLIWPLFMVAQIGGVFFKAAWYCGKELFAKHSYYQTPTKGKIRTSNAFLSDQAVEGKFIYFAINFCKRVIANVFLTIWFPFYLLATALQKLPKSVYQYITNDLHRFCQKIAFWNAPASSIKIDFKRPPNQNLFTSVIGGLCTFIAFGALTTFYYWIPSTEGTSFVEMYNLAVFYQLFWFTEQLQFGYNYYVWSYWKWYSFVFIGIGYTTFFAIAKEKDILSWLKESAFSPFVSILACYGIFLVSKAALTLLQIGLVTLQWIFLLAFPSSSDTFPDHQYNLDQMLYSSAYRGIDALRFTVDLEKPNEGLFWGEKSSTQDEVDGYFKQKPWQVHDAGFTVGIQWKTGEFADHLWIEIQLAGPEFLKSGFTGPAPMLSHGITAGVLHGQLHGYLVDINKDIIDEQILLLSNYNLSAEKKSLLAETHNTVKKQLCSYLSSKKTLLQIDDLMPTIVEMYRITNHRLHFDDDFGRQQLLAMNADLNACARK